MDEKKQSNVVDALERLQRLKDSGLLSDEEIAQQKAEILRSKTQTSSPTDPLLVRPETLKKISTRQSGGGHGLLWGILALVGLGVGGYFGAKALGIDIPSALSDGSIDLSGLTLPPPPLAIDLDVSKYSETNSSNPYETFTILEIQSKMDNLTVESVTVNRGNCKALNWKEDPSNKLPGDMSGGHVSIGGILQLEGLMSLGIRNVKAPLTLSFGDVAKLVYSRCDILEADILTDQGGVTVSFE